MTFLSTSKNDWRITLCILLIDLILLYRPLYACIELFSPSSCAACPSVPAFGVDFQYFSFFAILCFPRGDLCALVNVAACPQLFHIFHVWLFEGGVGCVHQWQQMWLLCTVPAWPIIPISPTPHPPPIHPKCKTTCRVYNIYIKKWSNNNIFLVIKAKEVKIMKEVISCDVKWRVPKKGWKIPKGEEKSQIIPQLFLKVYLKPHVTQHNMLQHTYDPLVGIIIRGPSWTSRWRGGGGGWSSIYETQSPYFPRGRGMDHEICSLMNLSIFKSYVYK